MLEYVQPETISPPTQLAPPRPSGAVCYYSALYVNAAYAAYNKTYQLSNSNQQPTAQSLITATNEIQRFVPNLQNINPIFVYQELANWIPLPGTTESKFSTPPPTDSNSPGGTPGWYVYGWACMGFTAYDPDQRVNILCFRGVQTDVEAACVGTRKGNLAPVSFNGYSCGNADTHCLNWYSQAQDTGYTPMNVMVQAAVRFVARANPSAPWMACAHSFGSALLALAQLDMVTQGLMNANNTSSVTFGGLSVGDAIFKKRFELKNPNPFWRVVNLCDWVPNFDSITELDLDNPFTQLGYDLSFFWDVFDFWGNHSMSNIYWPVVASSLFTQLRTLYPAKSTGFIAVPVLSSSDESDKNGINHDPLPEE